MSETLFEQDTSRGRILRVLDGERRGASMPLTLGQTVTIGYDYSNDVVLRSPGAKDVRLRLSLNGDLAALEVLAGEASLLGQTLKAPLTALLPPHVPVLLGDTAICFGDEHSERWVQAERIAAACRAETPLVQPSIDLPLPARGLRPPAPLALGVVVAVALIAALSWVLLAKPAERRPATDAKTVRAWLEQSPYRQLRLEQTADGGLVLQGVLLHDGDSAMLLRDLHARDLPVHSAVLTTDGMARQAEDLLRTAGVTATARPAGLGTVVVSANAPADRLEALRQSALNRIAGLQAIDFVAADSSATLGILSGGNPAKAVQAVSVEAGGFITVADGGRYFPGADLPNGQTLVAVRPGEIEVKKDGVTTRINY